MKEPSWRRGALRDPSSSQDTLYSGGSRALRKRSMDAQILPTQTLQATPTCFLSSLQAVEPSSPSAMASVTSEHDYLSPGPLPHEGWVLISHALQSVDLARDLVFSRCILKDCRWTKALAVLLINPQLPPPNIWGLHRGQEVDLFCHLLNQSPESRTALGHST